ncbi:MAG: hypothetical protein ACTTJM_08860 [Bergeyella cardium]
MIITELAKEKLKGMVLTKYALEIGKSAATIITWKCRHPDRFAKQDLYIKALVKVTGLKKEDLFKEAEV